MATAITLRSKSCDYFTKAFEDWACTLEIEEYIDSIYDPTLELIGFDCTNNNVDMKCVVEYLDYKFREGEQ